MLKRSLAASFALILFASAAGAGHTRIGYCDGCQSMDGRYVVTSELIRATVKGQADSWKFTWKDTKTGVTHTGALEGLRGVDHFVVTYAHVFVPPDGETFAVFNTAAWAGSKDGKVATPKGELKDIKSRGEDFRKMPCFADRLVIYKKTGEVLKRFSMNDLLEPNEFQFLHWVQGNLYWLREYQDHYVGKVEPPRCGYRYYRISPDYTVLEFTAGPDNEMRPKFKGMGDLENYGRVVRVRLTDGTILPPNEKLTDKNTIPVRPFVGSGPGRGSMSAYVPSLDPVRVAGKLDETKLKSK